MTQTDDPIPPKALRLWPGVAAATLQWLAMFGIPIVAPDASIYGMLGGVAGGLLVLIWWLFFSRAPWVERVGAIVLMVVAGVAVSPPGHPALYNGGMGELVALRRLPGVNRA